ncbi:MAG: WYL domain-containing protein [Actinomycetota bacterium]|nr:WYL domain-containing protein [Actinomycetota bacterium]
MSAHRTERLLNLVICLLATRQYLTAGRIRTIVPGYDHGEDERAHEAFQRMFERDKAELRDLGIPLETGTNSVFDTDAEVGYRIARRDYEFPAIDLEPDEAAAVGLAARLWQSGLSSAASSALVKLRSAGVEVDRHATLGVEPVVDATEPALAACLEAVQTSRVVRFDYRAANAGMSQEREVEPWGVVSRRGRWYLAGYDRTRGAARVFRLSRVSGPVSQVGPPEAVQVPPGLDLLSMASSMGNESATGTATVRVRRGSAAGLRRVARTSRADGDHDLLEVPYSDPEALAERLAGYAAEVVVLGPPDVRAAVIRLLRARAEEPA